MLRLNCPLRCASSSQISTTNIPTLSFSQAGCPSSWPTNSAYQKHFERLAAIYNALQLQEMFYKIIPFRLFIKQQKLQNIHFVGNAIEGLCERTEYLDIYFIPPTTQWCSISDILFTGGREVSDFSVLKYY